MVFEFLRIKVLSFKKDLDKHCMLVLDEMSITPSNSFDTSTNTFVGCVTSLVKIKRFSKYQRSVNEQNKRFLEASLTSH